jgi:hypothetical protein
MIPSRYLRVLAFFFYFLGALSFAWFLFDMKRGWVFALFLWAGLLSQTQAKYQDFEARYKDTSC